jgi:hypothetical protein
LVCDRGHKIGKPKDFGAKKPKDFAKKPKDFGATESQKILEQENHKA